MPGCWCQIGSDTEWVTWHPHEGRWRAGLPDVRNTYWLGKLSLAMKKFMLTINESVCIVLMKYMLLWSMNKHNSNGWTVLALEQKWICAIDNLLCIVTLCFLSNWARWIHQMCCIATKSATCTMYLNKVSNPAMPIWRMMQKRLTDWL